MLIFCEKHLTTRLHQRLLRLIEWGKPRWNSKRVNDVGGKGNGLAAIALKANLLTLKHSDINKKCKIPSHTHAYI